MLGPNLPAHIPSLYIQNKGEDVSTKVALSLTRATRKFVIRLTGGCGDMAPEDAESMYALFVNGFGTEYSGALIFGGTQMRLKDNPLAVHHGITEVAPQIARQSRESIVLGIVPRREDLKLSPYGMVISDEGDKPFFTIIHPDQDVCLVIQSSVDEGVIWDAEYLMSADIVQHLRVFAGWQSLLIAYNGGSVTEREILLWARNGWPVLLIAESGRMAERYANDREFLLSHPSVHVVDNSSVALSLKLTELGAIERTRTKMRALKTS